MSLETIWYTLVALYLFWLTAIAALVTALGVSAFRRWRNLRAFLDSQTQPTLPAPKFNRAALPRKPRRKA